MNLRDLQYLVAVADHRHFGKAAEACFVSQPTLSTQIKKLERELGVELVERNPRHILLTDAGERVVERARQVLAETDDIRSIARQAQDPESGTLRLGLFPTLRTSIRTRCWNAAGISADSPATERISPRRVPGR
jgi:LysR family hydrogen peroxide-inducible transcriptional activator